MRKSIFAALLFFAVAYGERRAGASATPTSVGAPALGIVVGSSGTEWRAVSGFVGAGMAGARVSAGDDVRRLAIAPGQQSALIQRGAEQVLEWSPISNGALGESRGVTSAIARANLLVFSPSGSYAALYSESVKRIQVLGGLSSGPAIVKDVDTAGFAAPVSALAISDDAAIAAVLSTADTSSAAAVSDDGSCRTLLHGAAISAIRYLPGSRTLAVADLGSNLISVVEDGGSAVILAGEAQGVHDPADLESSLDGRRIYVANRGANDVLVINRATQDVNSVSCACTPVALRRLRNSTVHVVDGRNPDAVWLLDTDSVDPWVAFMPERGK